MQFRYNTACGNLGVLLHCLWGGHMNFAIIALIIVGLTLALMIVQIMPISVTALAAAFAMGAFGIIEFNDILAQFGTSTFFCVPGMMVVGGALFETGFAQRIGHGIMRRGGSNEKVFLALIIVVVTIMSGFLSNTTCTAMFLPIADMAERSTHGHISRKKTYMAIAFGATIGGCATMVGSPSQHVMAQELLASGGHEQMSFFFGMPATYLIMAVMVIYFVVVGLKIADRRFGSEIEPVEQSEGEPQEFPKFTWRMGASALILVTVIVLIATKKMSSGAAALMGAAACVIFRVITLEVAVRSIHLPVCVLLGGLFAITEGFNVSGAGQLVVDFVIGIMGENGSGYLVFAVMMFVAMVLTNILDNIAAQALLGPICLALALHYGINPKTMVFALLVASNLAFVTPLGTPSVTMTLKAGYKFTDYTAVGGPLCLICYILTIVAIPLIYGLQ